MLWTSVEADFSSVADVFAVTLDQAVTLESHGDGFVVRTQRGTYKQTAPSPAFAAIARDLIAGPVSLTRILESGELAARGFESWFEAGMLAILYVDAEGTSSLLSVRSPPSSVLLGATQPIAARLEHDYHIRPTSDGFLLETPRSGNTARIAASLLASLLSLAQDDPSKQRCRRDRSDLAVLLYFLWHMNLVVAPSNPTAMTWSYHERLFHARSRIGTHVGAYGAVRQPADYGPDIAPPPADALSLPEPASLSMPLDRALRTRRSSRGQGDKALSASDLSTLLHHAIGMRERGAGKPESRSYPSGGGLYSLDVYLLINRCEGMQEGLYRYLPSSHRLLRTHPVPTHPRAMKLLLDYAQSATLGTAHPQVLAVIAARFDVVFDKYASVGYSLILKEAGAMLQSFYLVAGAMGLSLCALGGSYGKLFCQAAGIEFWKEGPVAEFILGSRAEAER